MLLTDNFIANYTNRPFPGTHFGEFIYLRTYSRWLDNVNRRERWFETVRRAVEYSFSLYSGPKSEEQLRPEAEKLFDDIFNMRIFPAGRTLWVGGTKAAEKYPSANFNCATKIINDLFAFTEIFYLLLVGAGVGFRILPEDVAQLQYINPHIILTNKRYEPVLPEDRRETTDIVVGNTVFEIIVGDSKEGWVEALRYYLDLITSGDVVEIVINYDNVRPKGEQLKTFGGRASGPEGLSNMFSKIHQIVQAASDGVLRPIDALDIANLIGEAVVVGGVRRTSEIGLFDINDEKVLNAKFDMWTPGTANYGKVWRSMSNNTIMFTERPTIEQLTDIFKRIKNNGEPGFLNVEAAKKRRPNFAAVNPCNEVLLDDRGVCNLTMVNVRAYVRENADGPYLDMDGLVAAVKSATRIGMRQTNVTLEMDLWDEVQKRDRLTGVSLSGWMDAMDLLGYKNLSQSILLEKLSHAANEESIIYAHEMRIPAPLLVTAIKPDGTLAQLPTVSSGLHRAFAPYYIRRVRITSTEPLAKIALDLGYPVYPENGTQFNGEILTADKFNQLTYDQQRQVLDNASTWVVEFPIKTDAVIKASDETAVEQFQRYLNFQKNYTDHNSSITITVGEDEWNEILNAVYENWDDYVGVSFIPKAEGIYPLMPYESITEEEYNRRMEALPDSEFTFLLDMYERKNTEIEIYDPSCATGACPVK